MTLLVQSKEMACGLDPLHLVQNLHGAVPVNLYALVGYIPAPLSDFLDGLRAQLVPDCRLRSHVSLLPPRPLNGPIAGALEQIQNLAGRTPSFRIELGNIEVFDETSVIYVGLASGSDELERIHGMLNHDCLSYAEPFCYHPHITLAQKFRAEELPRLRAIAINAWRGYEGPRSFDVDTITFVQNRLLPGVDGNGVQRSDWVDLAECSMADRIG